MTSNTREDSDNIQEEPRIVYFSSISENTKRFVDKLPFDSERIPLTRPEDDLIVDHDYVLVTPTYGAGRDSNAVPKQVVKFLKRKEHRQHCIGIIAGGNRNFGTKHYLLAGDILSEKLGKPFLYGFEVSGTKADVANATDIVIRWWNEYRNQKDSLNIK